jgi:hypothetical protein
MSDKICKNCGEVITDSKQRLYCDINCRVEYHEKNNTGRAKASAQKIQWSESDDVEKNYDCICPCCGQLHRLKLYWTGGISVTPRIRCKDCKKLANFKQPPMEVSTYEL